MPKTYLGDGVYADWDRGNLKLTTENGVEATNTIYLELEVLAKLMEFLRDSKSPINTI